MALSNNIDQHLEMMLNKKNRCEDWVTSLTFRNQCNEPEQGSRNADELSEIAEGYSDDVCVSSEGPRKRVRKLIVNEKLTLNLTCEWRNCDYGMTKNRRDFTQHFGMHVSEVPVVSKPDGSQCYQCAWEKCSFQSVQSGEIKRHIYFHAYHTTLKATASRLNDLWELSGCTLTGEDCSRFPNLSSSFECEISDCDFKTDVFQTFISHVNSHVDCLDLTVEPVISCKWRGCAKFKCRKKTFMKVHMRRHTGEKTLACPTCGTMFATNTKYMDHCHRKVPIRDESNQCQYCFRYYPNDRLLRDHMRYHIYSHKCSFCEMTFSTPALLANHVRYKHLDYRPFQCSQCSFGAIKVEDLNAHLNTHSTEPKYKCQEDSCNYSFRCAETLKRHYDSIHLKSALPIYKCHLCEKEYKRGTSLGMHLRMVHKIERLPGHSRFRYMQSKDGYYRLQVERYERMELNNSKGPLVSIDSEMQFNINVEPGDNESARKFTISVNNNEEKETNGSVIAIDELDVHGNVVYSTTVDKKLINDANFYFVDVEDCPVVNLEENEARNTVESGNALEPKEVSQPLYPFSKRRRRGRRVVTFSDYDCVTDEFVVRNE